MLLRAGACLGPYEILAPAGAGAMGEVYRARDPRLRREVAIKVLPAFFAANPDRLKRFEREARAASALNHPNILVVHDFGTHEGAPYLVSELLAGESLRARLAKGALPLRQTIDLAVQIAHGLAAAHHRGIVHRDLKPENLFLVDDGRVKILDFGLAKMQPSAHSASSEAAAETMTPSTATGVVLGTAGYMSPEQVRGRPVDARTDLFSLGCVLYEMLAGRPAFRRETVAETLTALVQQEPPPLPVERNVPPALERIVWHCLEKSRRDRFQSARDLAFDLEGLSRSPGAAIAPALLGKVARRPRLWLGVGIGAGLAVGLAIGLAVRVGALAGVAPLLVSTAGEAGDSRPPRGTFRQLTDLPGVEDSPRISPDGKSIVFVSRAEGNADLYLQRIGGHIPVNLTKDCPEDDGEPALSPDGERIAYRSECDGGGIFLMGATGESRRRLTDFGHDPAWSPDGKRIAVATVATRDPLNRNTTSQLWVVEVATGAKRLLSTGDAMQPSWSPGGARIAYWGVRAETGQRDLWTIPVEGGPAAEVTNDPAVDWDPVWSPDGRFLYFSSDRGGSMNLWRIAVDEASGRARGAPVPVTTPALWSGQISLSQDGRRLVYATLEERSSLYRADFDPGRGALAGTPRLFFSGSRVVFSLDLSPDGQWIVFGNRGAQEDLFVVRSDGSGYRQITDDPARDRWPAWSPEGTRIAFQSNRGGHYEIWSIRPDGSGLERLVAASGAVFPNWSPDGRTLSAIGLLQAGLQGYVVPAGHPLADPLARRLPPIPGGLSFAPACWSPDGTQLAGTGARQDGLLVGIFTFSLASGSYSKLTAIAPTPVVARLRWMPNGRGIAYAEKGGLFLLDAQSGKSRELLPRNTLGGTSPAFAFSRDGRTLVYGTTLMEGDVWLMNLE